MAARAVTTKIREVRTGYTKEVRCKQRGRKRGVQIITEKPLLYYLLRVRTTSSALYSGEF